MPVPGSLKRVVILLYKIMTCLIISEQTTRMKINLSNNIWKTNRSQKKQSYPRILRRHMTNRGRKFHDRLSNRSLRRNKCIGNVGWNPRDPWTSHRLTVHKSVTKPQHRRTENVHGFPVWSELRNDLEVRGKKAHPSATEWRNQIQKWERQTDKGKGRKTRS